MHYPALIFTLAVAAITVYFVVVPFLQKEHFQRLLLLEERERLDWKRQVALQNIKELDFDLSTKKISEADHASLRETLIGKTVALTHELKAMDERIEDKQIEMEIQKRRHQG